MARPAAPETQPAAPAAAGGEPSVPELVRRAQVGDNAAFEALVARLHDAVLRQIVFWVGPDHARAEDISQETWLRAHRGLRGYTGESGFYTWVCAIARNESRRPRKAHPPVQKAEAHEPQAQAEQAEQVRSVLQELPDEFREPLLLELWEDMSLRQIAEVLGLPEGTVKSRLHRAREKFRAAWQAREES